MLDRLKIVALGLVLGLGGTSSTLAQDAGPQIMPNYREADIRQIIEAVGEVTGRNFLVDPRVNADVTLLSYTPMSPDAFYDAFLATLQVHGYAALEAGDVVKIVLDANARQLPGAEIGADGDRFVTQTVELQNIGAAQLVPILRPLVPQYGHLTAHPTSNILIIADRASNVKRMLNIIARMDQAGAEDIEVVHLQNASASEVVRMLTTRNQAAAAAGGAPTARIAADERTNSVLISGNLTGRLRYRALIAHLDTPNEDGGDTRVRYLDYADAEDLATNLQTQFSALGAAGTAGDSTQGVSIWADAGTNALIINAAADVIQDMNSVIDRLDIPRAQVKVDAIIVEVSDETASALGVTWAAQGYGSNNPVAFTNFGSTLPGIIQLGTAGASGTPDPSALPEGAVLAVGQIRDNGTSWAAILSALRGDARNNFISTPTIVTLDNEEAEIRVGQEVPFLTGSFTNTGAAAGAVNPFQTIQREEVGVSLKITPQIDSGSGVKLTIEQAVSSIDFGASGSGAVDLVTNNRSITTTVFVEDRDILVLGGLIDDSLSEREQRVPFLGRIPGLGWLFRARTTEKVNRTLMVFIRPIILRDSVQASFETDAKYSYIRDLQLQQAEETVPLMRNAERPLLPEISEPVPMPTLPPVQSEESEADGG
jgi:general secretion pathway protein D